MHTTTFLQDLAVVMMVAGLVTIVFHRFKQPVVLGYIIAGVIVGPYTPPYPLIHNQDTIKTLSELGVILLMFSLGLEFSLKKLKQVGGIAFIAAFLEILLMIWVGYEIGRSFGWNTMDCIFLGAMLSISSTTIIVKALAELGKAHERFAQLIFGILIIEDMLAIAMIALLSSIAMTGSFNVMDVGKTLGKLSLFLTVSLVIGLLTVPKLLSYVAKFKSNEMLLVIVLGLCFGFSLLAIKLGFSVALGAFIIGAVIAESREIYRIENLIEPVRDMFSAIFFVSIGLLIDPKTLSEYWLPVLLITIAVVIGKITTCTFGAFVGGNDTRTSLRVGMGLAQIGEFSFIIASLGLTLHVTSNFLYPIAVAVSAITTLLTPYLIKSTDLVVSQFDRLAPRSLVNILELYTSWVGQLGRQNANSAMKMARRWLRQMALNAILIAAVFLTVAFIGKNPPTWMKEIIPSQEWLRTILWLVAVLFSLPMFIATSRKLRALGLLLAEVKVTEAAAGAHTPLIRTIVEQAVPIAGTIMLGLFTLLLSSTLLPTFKVLFVLLILIALVSWLLRRSFIKIYARAQIALEETLASPPVPRQRNTANPLPPLLCEADLETVNVTAKSAVIGKRIRELQLRTQTGASIVGIERKGENIINPSPDEEIHEGDQLLLVGSRAQLDASLKLFPK